MSVPAERTLESEVRRTFRAGENPKLICQSSFSPAREGAQKTEVSCFLLTNSGGGLGDFSVTLLVGRVRLPDQVKEVKTGDIDGDQHVDIAVGLENGGELVFRNLGPIEPQVEPK